MQRFSSGEGAFHEPCRLWPIDGTYRTARAVGTMPGITSEAHRRFRTRDTPVRFPECSATDDRGGQAVEGVSDGSIEGVPRRAASVRSGCSGSRTPSRRSAAWPSSWVCTTKRCGTGSTRPRPTAASATTTHHRWGRAAAAGERRAALTNEIENGERSSTQQMNREERSVEPSPHYRTDSDRSDRARSRDRRPDSQRLTGPGTWCHGSGAPTRIYSSRPWRSTSGRTEPAAGRPGGRRGTFSAARVQTASPVVLVGAHVWAPTTSKGDRLMILIDAHHDASTNLQNGDHGRCALGQRGQGLSPWRRTGSSSSEPRCSSLLFVFEERLHQPRQLSTLRTGARDQHGRASDLPGQREARRSGAHTDPMGHAASAGRWSDRRATAQAMAGQITGSGRTGSPPAPARRCRRPAPPRPHDPPPRRA